MSKDMPVTHPVGTLTYSSVEDARNNAIVYRASVRLLASQDFQRLEDYSHAELAMAMAVQELRKQVAQPKCPSSWYISPTPNEWYYACQEGLQHARAVVNCLKIPKDPTKTESMFGDGSRKTLLEYVKLADEYIERAEKVLHRIPECPTHGKDCLPHYIEWIIDMRNVDDHLKKFKDTDDEMATFALDRLRQVIEIVKGPDETYATAVTRLLSNHPPDLKEVGDFIDQYRHRPGEPVKEVIERIQRSLVVNSCTSFWLARYALFVDEPLKDVMARLDIILQEGVAGSDQIFGTLESTDDFTLIWNPDDTPVEEALREDLYREYKALRALMISRKQPYPVYRYWLEARAIGLLAESGLRQTELRQFKDRVQMLFDWVLKQPSQINDTDANASALVLIHGLIVHFQQTLQPERWGLNASGKPNEDNDWDQYFGKPISKEAENETGADEIDHPRDEP